MGVLRSVSLIELACANKFSLLRISVDWGIVKSHEGRQWKLILVNGCVAMGKHIWFTWPPTCFLNWSWSRNVISISSVPSQKQLLLKESKKNVMKRKQLREKNFLIAKILWFCYCLIACFPFLQSSFAFVV